MYTSKQALNSEYVNSFFVFFFHAVWQVTKLSIGLVESFTVYSQFLNLMLLEAKCKHFIVVFNVVI